MAGGGMAVVVVVLGVALTALVFDLQLEVLRAHFLHLQRLDVPRHEVYNNLDDALSLSSL